MRKTLKIRWQEKMTYKKMRETAEMMYRRWNWIGHVLRRDGENECMTVLGYRIGHLLRRDGENDCMTVSVRPGSTVHVSSDNILYTKGYMAMNLAPIGNDVIRTAIR